MTHSGLESVVCLQGQCEYIIEGKYYALNEGDSLMLLRIFIIIGEILETPSREYQAFYQDLILMND